MPHPHLTDTLAQVTAETEALVADAKRLTPADLAVPSRCARWSRAHVLAHLARNADSLVNLATWARTGVETPAYRSPEARERDIEEGATRSRSELLADVVESAARLDRAFESLHGPAGDAEVTTRAGTTVRGTQLPAMRLQELVLHHVDLRTGYSLADADPGWVRRTLTRGLRRWAARDDAPDLVLRAPDEQWVLGAGGPVVSGTEPALLLWLARGDAEGLQVAGGEPLPAPPPWG
ncbi:maleylpyruvate isomerase family mycothiol-dependent enzyme [Ornithinicoccus halotolerans]|uniref:maleylpyruvate isomerase family mycothiol-dependent enzyme n=1 Tax=Ornithinicoccus halotolerans TaxID=1748220 RepID=UPI0018861677|nr:maleylpyruvate isomerase family mycothiol-dependent enzyme [Ornithinicoccus halotolerans]